MTFSRGLFQEALHALSLNWPVALLFLAGQLLLQIFGDSVGGGGFGVQFFLFAILAICIHQAVIKPGFVTPYLTQRSMMWGYGWRLGAILIVCGAAGFFMASLVVRPYEGRLFFFGIAVIVALVVCALILSMWGTVLPAVAVEGDASFSSATARGKITFQYSAFRLFFCCGPLFIAVLALPLLLLGIFGPDALNDIDEPPAGSAAAAVIISVMGVLLGLFNIALVSTILSRAYLTGEEASCEASI
jgi:hypothetical protein